MTQLDFIDSHTAGEPTRVILGGVPDLGTGNAGLAAKSLAELYDWVRTASLLEPRGSDVLVGAYLVPNAEHGADAAVVFFNNAGYLGMCGHGTIGLVKTLEHLGQIEPGPVTIDTPVGRIRAVLEDDGSVSVRNVPAYRYAAGVEVEVPGIGMVKGDVAYGGNWFFLVNGFSFSIGLANMRELTEYSQAVRDALTSAGITGANGAEIDHIELFVNTSTADSRNFVLCPGGAYDRSPCGTGTSAKLACLYADGKIEPGQWWRQESVIGSQFEGKVEIVDGAIIPTIKGRAWITAQGSLLIDPTDPYGHGILV